MNTRSHGLSASLLRLVALAWALALLVGVNADAEASVPVVKVHKDAQGSTLQVDGRDFMVFGMNWGYMPIGENYAYDFWGKPDDFIKSVLEREMPLLQGMGVNTIRQYVGIPARWVQYIYERYGIYTVVNHPVARWGATIDGVWTPVTDYSDPRLRSMVKEEIAALVEEFRDTPGLLMWLLGNENNYGLSWSSFEIEALPEGEQQGARARFLYSLYGEIIDLLHEGDANRPVAIANGDVQYIDIMAEECADLDVFGTNVYRGISVRDLYQVVQDKMGIPVLFTEFGADAFNAREMREDQAMQARYLIGQWQEIYEQSANKGRVGNAIGGLIFQWSDGWWKYKQEERLDIHDTNASWPNGGYVEDYVEGQNNMNEEWWGICAKGPNDAQGMYDVYPRAAYYALRDAFRLAPYSAATDLDAIRAHFARITPANAVLDARGDQASLLGSAADRVRLKGLRMEFETFGTGGARVSTPPSERPNDALAPAFRGFDRLESFYADIEAKPTEAVVANLSINVLGNVPRNPIDQIFYENRGTRRRVQLDNDQIFELNDIERVKVYRGAISWDDRWFQLNGFYRTGHLHWQYEGDFFGLYRDAYYGENIDIYNGEAPIGVEIAGKRMFNGLKLAFGPQLWWGANPALFLKYQRQVGRFATTTIYQEDLTSQQAFNSSIAVPLPPVRKATFQVETKVGPFGVQAGGIWSGSNKKGEEFQFTRGSGDDTRVLVDEVLAEDALGAKAKVTWERGRWHWYAQAAHMGLVADAGPTAIPTYTGWFLKDSGTGNQNNVLTGLAMNVGDFQVSPNFLWQKPLIGPMPNDTPPRNVLDDPFAVRGNRETVGAELMITYDPDPATWMWAWDNDVRENARFAAALGLSYRDVKTNQDASIGILKDGRTTFRFGASTPARELYEINLRVVSKLGPATRFVGHAYYGTGEPNGDDTRLLHRGGIDGRLINGSVSLAGFAKFNDWGPYDYHRDFNLTYPVQLMGDVSYSLGSPSWFADFPSTKIGVRGLWRSLDEYSPRWAPEGVDPFTGEPVEGATGPEGNEWELRTYLHIAI